MSERRPDLQDVILRAVEANARDIYTMIPAKIVKWDASNQRANCQILVKNVTFNEAGERVVSPWPVVPGVPVQFMGAGGFRITCPISDGNLVIDGETIPATTGSLLFSHRSLDKWLTGGGEEVDPEFDQSHALGDAVFVPGLKPFGDPWASMPTDHMTVGADAGVQIHLHADTICIGDEDGQEQFIAMAQKVLDELDDIATALSTHTHSGVQTGSGDTGGSNSTYSASSVAASQGKVR